MTTRLFRLRPVPAACALATLLVLACGDGGTDPDPVDDIEVASVTVTPAELDIPLEGEGDLAARVLDTDGTDVTDRVTVQWSSSPAGIVVVDDQGHVTAITEGVANVSARAGGRTGAATVEVYDPTPPTGPTDVTATVVSDTRVALTWTDRADNEDGYRVEREAVGAGATPGGPAAVFSEVANLPADATAWDDTDAVPGTAYRYRVRACNRNGCVPAPGSAEEAEATSATVTTEETLAVTTTALPDGYDGVAYERALAATGGSGGYAWSVTEGALPSGVSLDGDGVLAGTPDTPGSATFTVTITSGNQVATAELTLTIQTSPEAPEVVTETLPTGQRNEPYAFTLEAAKGDGTYQWDNPGGGLPPGISLSGGGQLTGASGVVGRWNFTVRVRSFGLTGTRVLTMEVVAPLTITSTSLEAAQLGVTYGRTVQVDGGNGTYTWSLVSGSLPPGMDFDGATGRVSGTPTEVGLSTFTVRVESAGQTATRELTLEVRAAPVVFESVFIPGAYVGTGFQSVLEASGGDGVAYAWTVTAGALPDGLTLGAGSGILAGTPTGAGVSYFTIEVESGNQDARRTFAMAVSGSAAGAFNLWVANVASSHTIPSARVLEAVSDAVGRWEEVIVGDLPDRSYGPNAWSTATCSGHAPILNGQSLDDMVLFLDLTTIDGPDGILGSAGPCAVRTATWPAVSTTFGQLRLDTDDLASLSELQLFALAFHEIGHVVGLGTLWTVPDGSSGTPLISGRSGPDPRYEGPGGNGVFTGTLGGGSQGAAKIPIEADGGGGTRDAHWDEGEFDVEIMTGWAEGSGVSQPISAMTIAAVGDLAYVVDTGAADPYTIDTDCAPGCSALRAAAGSGEGDARGIPLVDDVWRGPIALELPNGEIVEFRPPGGG